MHGAPDVLYCMVSGDFYLRQGGLTENGGPQNAGTLHFSDSFRV